MDRLHPFPGLPTIHPSHLRRPLEAVLADVGVVEATMTPSEVVVEPGGTSKIGITFDVNDRRRRHHHNSGGRVISREKQFGSLSAEKRGGRRHSSVAKMSDDPSGLTASVTLTGHGEISHCRHPGWRHAIQMSLLPVVHHLLRKLHRLCKLIRGG